MKPENKAMLVLGILGSLFLFVMMNDEHMNALRALIVLIPAVLGIISSTF